MSYKDTVYEINNYIFYHRLLTKLNEPFFLLFNVYNRDFRFEINIHYEVLWTQSKSFFYKTYVRLYVRDQLQDLNIWTYFNWIHTKLLFFINKV